MFVNRWDCSKCRTNIHSNEVGGFCIQHKHIELSGCCENYSGNLSTLEQFEVRISISIWRNEISVQWKFNFISLYRMFVCEVFLIIMICASLLHFSQMQNLIWQFKDVVSKLFQYSLNRNQILSEKLAFWMLLDIDIMQTLDMHLFSILCINDVAQSFHRSHSQFPFRCIGKLHTNVENGLYTI